MGKPFIITKVSWLTSTPGLEDRRDSVVRDHYYLAKFLQENKLVRRRLTSGIEDITDEFTISSDDLTENGLSVMKIAYDKWISKIDNGMSPEDVSLLNDTLKKIKKI